MRNMEDIYRHYTDNIRRVRMEKGSFEVEHEDLERLLGLLMAFKDEELGSELVNFRERVLATLTGTGDARSFLTVRPAQFIPEQE